MPCEYQTDLPPIIKITRLTPTANASVTPENKNGLSISWCQFLAITTRNDYAKCLFPDNQRDCPNYYNPNSEEYTNQSTD